MAKKDNSQSEIHIETNSESEVSSGADEQSDRIAELTADLQRVQAEFVNYRRRAESEKAEMLEQAKRRVIKEFLAVRDSFDQELAHRPAKVDPEWAATIDSIRSQFDLVLASLSIERFESKGRAFDPHIHDAIAVDDGDGEHEVVTEELQPGYNLAGRVLRHAIVKVGKSDQAPASDQPTEPSP